MLPPETDLTDFQACLEIGRADLAWEELRAVSEAHPMGFTFFVQLSKAADALERR